MVLGCIAINLGLALVGRLNRSERQIGGGWFVLLFLFLTVAFGVLHPMSLKHPREDREDALRLELNAVRHHQYPYDARTFLNNPPTPLPGAILLDEPFFLIGHLAWQNIFWCGCFFLFTLNFFKYRATALFFLTLFLVFSLENLYDFTSGGDYLVNFFYVSVAIALFVKSLVRPSYAWIPASLFLGIALSSRVLFPPILAPLLALSLQRSPRFRVTASFALILFAGCGVSFPIFAPHPIARFMQVELEQNANKLQFIPLMLHPHWTIPLVTVILASIPFFFRMDMPRLWLNFSATSFAMLAPFVISFCLHSRSLLNNTGYLEGSFLPFSLWALSRYEQFTLPSLRRCKIQKRLPDDLRCMPD